MKDLTEHSKELIAGVETLAKTAGYTAQVTVINNCPSSWGIVIAAAGVKFFYRDGTDYTDGPRVINLSSGQSATFTSNDSNKCVYQFFLAMTVTAPNQPPQNMTEQDGVPDGQCLVHESVTLGPKSNSVATGTKIRLADILKLSKG